jgi:hypothetical protein
MKRLRVKPKRCEVVPVLNYAARHENILRTEGMAPSILIPGDVSRQIHSPARFISGTY